jgi:hypothetical protein
MSFAAYDSILATLAQCLLFGVRTETFSWITMMPLVLFCLLGPRAGAITTFGLIGESLFIYSLTPDGTNPPAASPRPLLVYGLLVRTS